MWIKHAGQRRGFEKEEISEDESPSVESLKHA
jgi:hypothetical protein